MMLSRCSICNNKESTFLSQGSGWLDSLGLNTLQNRIKMLYRMLLIDKITDIYKI